MRSHQRHAAVHFLVGTVVEGLQHTLVRPTLEFLSIVGLGQIPQRGRIGHMGGLTGRDLSVGIAHVTRQAIEQGKTMHQQSGSSAGDRLVPGAEHLAAAPALLEKGVALGHATPVGTCQIGIAHAQLHAKVVERGTAHAGTSFDHVQVIRAKQHARQHAAYTGGGAFLAVAAKRAFAVLHTQPHVQHATIALEPQLDSA